MSPAKAHSLNEATAPIPQDLFGQLASAEPKDAIAIAEKLPLENRAKLAAFCYTKRHMNHLGLLIASTCDRMALRRAMGSAGDICFQQSRNVEKTMAADRSRRSGKGITLATAANVVPLRREILADMDAADKG